MTSYPIYSVKKTLNFQSAYSSPYPVDVSGEKSSMLIRHSDACGSSVNGISIGYGYNPKIRNFDLQEK